MGDLRNPNTVESNLNIKEATPRRRSMTISKYQPDLNHLSNVEAVKDDVGSHGLRVVLRHGT